MADPAQSTTIFSANDSSSSMISSMAQKNWIALRQLLQQITGSFLSDPSKTTQVDSSFLHPSFQQAESPLVTLNVYQTEQLLAELTRLLPAVAPQIQPEAIQQHLFEWSQAHNDPQKLSTWAKELLDIADGKGPEVTQQRSGRKRVSEEDDSATPSDTATSSSAGTNTTGNAQQPDESVFTQNANTTSTSSTTDMNSSDRPVNEQSARHLVEQALKDGYSYRDISVRLTQSCLRPVLEQELAALNLPVTITYDELAKLAGTSLDGLTEQFSNIAQAYVRKEIAENPGFGDALSSAETRLLVVSDFARKLHEQTYYRMWRENVAYVAVSLAAGKQNTTVPVDVPVDVPQPTSTTSPADQADSATPQSPTALSEQPNEPLATPEEVAQIQKRSVVSPLNALQGVSPEEQEKIKQTLILAAAYGLEPEKIAEQGSKHFQLVFGVKATNPPEEIRAIIEEAAWKHLPPTVIPAMIGEHPVWEFPDQVKWVYLTKAQRTLEQTDLQTLSPADRTALVAELVAHREVATLPSSPSISPATGARLKKTLDMDENAQKIAEDVDAFKEELRKIQNEVFIRQSYLPADNGPDQNYQLQDDIDAYLADISSHDDFSYSPYEEMSGSGNEQFETYAPMPMGASGGGRFNPISNVRNLLQQRFGKKPAAGAAKGVASGARKLTAGAVNQATKQLTSGATKTAGAGLASAAAAVPVVGAPLSAGIKILTDDNTRLIAAGALGGGVLATGTLISNALSALGLGSGAGTLGGAVSSTLGSLTGGGGSAAASAASVGGGGGGGALGMGTAGSGGSGAGGASFLKAATSKVIAAMSTPAAVGVGGAVGAIGIGTLVTMSSLFQAFLVNTPSATGEDVSKYVKIEKRPTPEAPNNKYDNPQNLAYNISICAKKGYKVTISSIKDDFTINTNDEEREKAGIPKDPKPVVPSSPVNTASLKDKTTLDSTGDTEGCVQIDPYTINFDSSYVHTSVKNTVLLNFTAVDAAGSEQSDGGSTSLQAIGSATVCFGKCPTALAKCWPTTGTVSSEPFQANLPTHAGTDAIDIANATGNPVYTPFSGTAYFYSDGSGIFTQYGNHVFFISDDGTFALIYAHMARLTQSGQGVHVEEGDQLGWVGETGNATGPHLHLELRLPGTSFHSFSGYSTKEAGQPTMPGPTYESGITGGRPRRPTILELMMPQETPNHTISAPANGKGGTPVKSCYGN